MASGFGHGWGLTGSSSLTTLGNKKPLHICLSLAPIADRLPTSLPPIAYFTAAVVRCFLMATLALCLTPRRLDRT